MHNYKFENEIPCDIDLDIMITKKSDKIQVTGASEYFTGLNQSITQLFSKVRVSITQLVFCFSIRNSMEAMYLVHMYSSFVDFDFHTNTSI